MLAECSASPRPRRRWYLALALAVALGTLTHYSFPFVVLGSGVYALVRLVRIDRPRLGVLAGAVICGVLLAWLAFPFHTQLAARGSPDPAVFADHRGDGASIAALEHSLRQPLLASPFAIACAAVLALGAALVQWRLRPHPEPHTWHHGWQTLFLVVCVAGAALLPRTFGLSPPHAVGVKYMAPVFGLLPFIPVLALRALRRWQVPALLALCIVQGSPAIARGYSNRKHVTLQARILPDMRLVTHTVNRLHLPNLLARLRPEAKLLVADRDALLVEAASLADEGPFTYAACGGTAFSSQQSRELRAELDQYYTRIRRDRSFGKCWRLHGYRLSRKEERLRRRARVEVQRGPLH